MLEVQDMRLSFSRYRTLLRREWLPVLNGVSVSVQRGELVSLIGASGAGKSLLAHAVLGILPSTTKLSGTMQFEGFFNLLFGFSPAAMYNHSCGRMPK